MAVLGVGTASSGREPNKSGSWHSGWPDWGREVGQYTYSVRWAKGPNLQETFAGTMLTRGGQGGAAAAEGGRDFILVVSAARGPLPAEGPG